MIGGWGGVHELDESPFKQNQASKIEFQPWKFLLLYLSPTQIIKLFTFNFSLLKYINKDFANKNRVDVI